MGPSVKTFGAMRVAVGAGSWISPRFSARLFGLDAGTPPMITRLFGVRDAVLGAALLDPDPVHQRRALQAGVVCDTVDAMATVMSVRKRDLGAQGALLIGGGAVLFAALGVLALRNHEETIETA